LILPSWQELTEKISEFDRRVNVAIGKKVQGFQEKYPLSAKVVDGIISIVPPPFNSIAKNIYTTSVGSDEEKLEKIKDFLDTIQKQGEEHYNSLLVKSDTIIQEVLNLKDKAAKEETLKLVMDMMTAQADTINQKLEQIRENLDQIKYWVRESNNIIGKNINKLAQEIKPTGLTLLEPDYFEKRKNVKDDFENWKKGYTFELPSIYQGYEFKREIVINEIKQMLDANHKLLLLGESGTSKSTIMMEIMCDYFRKEYTVLHNLGYTQLAQANDIVQYIENLLKAGNKLLIAIDNTHDKKMCSIFYIINQLSFIEESNNILFILTARLPEYNTLVNKRLLELEEQDRIALKKFNEKTENKYLIPHFKNVEEIEHFFNFYKTKYNVERSSSDTYLDIFNETDGHPIMVKFFLLGKGLREDVEKRYKFYLFNSETKKPIAENIRTIFICALFSISNHKITDKDLEDMKVRTQAKSISGILRRRENGSWTTIHPRWDMELFSYLFSSQDEDEVYERQALLSDACHTIFDSEDKDFSLSVISTLYEMAGKNLIPINILNDVIRLPDYILNDKEAMYSIHAYDKSYAYYDLKRYSDMLFESEEALKINPNYAAALGIKGLALYELNKHEEAIKWFDKALEIDSKNSDVIYNKGLALYELNKYEEAIQWFDKALQLNPKDSDAIGSKGNALSSLGKHEEAIKWFDKALQLNPKDSDAIDSKGDALSSLGKYEEAIDCFDKALKIRPSYVSALYNKGDALSSLGKYEEAIDWYDKVLKIDPSYVSALGNKGDALSSLGKYEEAIDCFDKALKIDPSYVSALDSKGDALSSLGKYEEAIDCFDKALKIDPSYDDALNNKGRVLCKLGKYDEAIQWFDKALQIDPKDVGVINNKGAALYDLGNYEEAVQWYDNALNVDPDYISSLHGKGAAFYELGKYDEAIQWFDKALQIDPNYIDSFYGKGLSLANLQKYEEAIQWYDKALQIDPKYVKVVRRKGVALAELNKYEEAIQWYDKALQIDPANVDALHDKGVALAELQKYEEAIQWYDKALKKDPNNYVTLYSKGAALGNLGEYKEAMGLFDKVLKMDPSDYLSLLNKGAILSRLGAYEEAIMYFDKVLTINTNEVDALMLKGHALYKSGQYEKAIGCYDQAILIAPSSAKAWYNRSCYMVKSGNIDGAIYNLAEAIRLDKKYKESAVTDKDFDSIRNNAKFKQLMGMSN